MMHRLKRFAHLLVRVNDSHHRTALAFSIGVFIAFFPLIGLHTALALAIAFLFRLNRVAILLGAYLNNPWTMGPLFSAGTLVGCILTGVSPEGLWSSRWGAAESALWTEMLSTLRRFIWPYIVGNLTLGVPASTLSYAAVRWLLACRGTRFPAAVVSGAAISDPS